MAEWKTPEDLKYTENDEWIRVSGNTARIGLTDYAQDNLSDLVFVELPDVGDTLTKGEVFASVESVKAASDLRLGQRQGDRREHCAGQRAWTINSDPYVEG